MGFGNVGSLVIVAKAISVETGKSSPAARMDCEEAETWSVEILLGRFHDEGELKRGAEPGRVCEQGHSHRIDGWEA